MARRAPGAPEETISHEARFMAEIEEIAGTPDPEPAPPSPPDPQVPMPELDESEKAYVGQLFTDVAAAREALRLAEDRGSAYFAYLAARHGLDVEKDFINQDGSITRNPKAE